MTAFGLPHATDPSHVREHSSRLSSFYGMHSVSFLGHTENLGFALYWIVLECDRYLVVQQLLSSIFHFQLVRLIYHPRQIADSA